MTEALRPLIVPVPRRVRLAMQVGSAVAVAVAVTTLLAERDLWPVSAALVAASALVLARGVRARVELWEEEIVVRDYLFSTRIPRDRVMTVHRFPSIDWRGADGVPRETLVNAFNPQELDLFGPTDAELSRIRVQLRAWIDAPATGGDRNEAEQPAAEE